MATWLPVVNANELILSAWGNDVRKLPAGVVGTIESQANSGGVAATPAASTLIVAATVPAGRRIRASACVTMQQLSVPSGAIHAAIYLDGAMIVQAVAVQPVGFVTLNPMRVTSAAAGARTWQVYVWTDAGSALIAGTVSPATLIVEDVGAV
jgi:hypothetical protein